MSSGRLGAALTPAQNKLFGLFDAIMRWGIGIFSAIGDSLGAEEPVKGTMPKRIIGTINATFAAAFVTLVGVKLSKGDGQVILAAVDLVCNLGAGFIFMGMAFDAEDPTPTALDEAVEPAPSLGNHVYLPLVVR